MEELVINIDGKEYRVKIEEAEDGKLKVFCDGDVYTVETRESITESIAEEVKKKESAEGGNIIIAPLPGTVVSINVKKGDKVNNGDTLIKLIAMKMENEIVAPKDGRVKDIKVDKNDNVDKGDVLVILE